MAPRWSPVSAPDLPDRLILFDGVCVLCSGWVQFVLKRDRDARFRFVAIQTPLGEALAKRLGINASNPESNVAIVDGQAYFKLDSVLVVLAHFSAWRWTAIAYAAPRAVRNFFYDRIARNRYRLFGKTDQCMIPDAAIRRRFISELADAGRSTTA